MPVSAFKYPIVSVTYFISWVLQLVIPHSPLSLSLCLFLSFFVYSPDFLLFLHFSDCFRLFIFHDVFITCLFSGRFCFIFISQYIFFTCIFPDSFHMLFISDTVFLLLFIYPKMCYLFIPMTLLLLVNFSARFVGKFRDCLLVD